MPVKHVRLLITTVTCDSFACVTTDAVQSTAEADSIAELQKRGWSRGDNGTWLCLRCLARRRKEVA